MELLTQIEQLQGQLESLKSQAIVSNALHVKKHTQAPVMNVILRDAVQSRQSTLADVQGLMSGYVQQQHDISPINTLIKLGADRVQRHRELAAMRHAKLQITREFLLRRSRGLEPGRQYCEEERFETSRGDYCALRFAVSHFRGAASVRAVFDAALVQIANVEMVMSDVLGNITIREDDDNGDDNFTQLRLVTSTGAAPEAPPLETNSLQFNEFHEATSSGGPHGAATSEFGIIMADFVDEDELYPYKSQERMRKDDRRGQRAGGQGHALVADQAAPLGSAGVLRLPGGDPARDRPLGRGARAGDAAHALSETDPLEVALDMYQPHPRILDAAACVASTPFGIRTSDCPRASRDLNNDQTIETVDRPEPNSCEPTRVRRNAT
ncbi:hypothetical protein ON010_g18718 [Phytophthora cinnamomi]|nr:hypothetical protein ON010_g18718 [Phytophthora cinnamomi]